MPDLEDLRHPNTVLYKNGRPYRSLDVLYGFGEYQNSSRIKVENMENNKESKLRPIIYVNWEEGSYNVRFQSDGCSLHLTEEDSKKYIENYWEGAMKKIWHVYSRPSLPISALVNPKLYNAIKSARSVYGYRLDEADHLRIKISKELIFENK